MKIYIASSWKNTLYHSTMAFLEEFQHTIMDWQDPDKGSFKWLQTTEIPVDKWTGTFYRDTILTGERAKRGFNYDTGLMDKADACVLLLPAGRSAHLEAGWFAGAGKPLFIYMPVWEGPDLMYKFAQKICFTLEELVSAINDYNDAAYEKIKATPVY